MRKSRLGLPILLLVAFSAGSTGRSEEAPPPEPASYRFVNGLWFDGESFRPRVVYAKGGTFVDAPPVGEVETVDLAGGHVLPPFADAHCHHFDSPFSIDSQVAMYLREGVFYAKVQTDVRSGAQAVAAKVNRPTSVDVVYAHGALTPSFGHGVEIYEALALGIYRRPTGPEEIARIRASRLRRGDAYHIVDTAADLEAVWPDVLGGKPDFLKIYLLTSEEFEVRKARTNTVGDRGLDPALVPRVVAKAHAAGLRVSAHVDTVTDVRLAISSGVDELAHLPGYYVGPGDDPGKYELTDADVAELARRGTWVVLAPVDLGEQSADAQARSDPITARNLKLLAASRIKVAFGSDSYGRTPLKDVRHLEAIGAMSRLDLLRTWCRETPKTIFPGRKLGELSPGFEASFIVLGGNPLDDFDRVKDIRYRFKAGRPLDPAAPRPPGT